VSTSDAGLGPFVNASVHDYVWGFDSDLLLWANKTFGALIPNSTINSVVSVQFNDTSEEDTRKRYKYQPDSMNTGNSDSNQLNQFVHFRGSPDLKIWGDTEANTVKGSDGLGFKVDIQGYENLLVFVDTLYRHLQFLSNTTVELKGIPTSVYFLDSNEFNNATNNPYYLNDPPGVSNITAVNVIQQGSPVPVLVSQPHFFQADPYYINQIEFLPPNDVTNLTLHNTFLYVEPHTGLTFKANKRLQVNLQVKPTLMTYPNIKPTFIPVIWVEETSELTDAQAQQWLSSVGVVIQWKQYAPVILFCLAGLSLFIAGSVLFSAYIQTIPPDNYAPINQ